MRTRQCGFERERAEAEVLLQLDKVQAAKHGIAVTCERTSIYSNSLGICSKDWRSFSPWRSYFSAVIRPTLCASASI